MTWLVDNARLGPVVFFGSTELLVGSAGVYGKRNTLPGGARLCRPRPIQHIHRYEKVIRNMAKSDKPSPWDDLATDLGVTPSADEQEQTPSDETDQPAAEGTEAEVSSDSVDAAPVAPDVVATTTCSIPPCANRSATMPIVAAV